MRNYQTNLPLYKTHRHIWPIWSSQWSKQILHWKSDEFSETVLLLFIPPISGSRMVSLFWRPFCFDIKQSYYLIIHDSKKYIFFWLFWGKLRLLPLFYSNEVLLQGFVFCRALMMTFGTEKTWKHILWPNVSSIFHLPTR